MSRCCLFSDSFALSSLYLSMFCASSRPWLTSACGGTIPYDAETWARRKFEVCGHPSYRQAAQLIEKYKQQLLKEGMGS